MTLKEKLIYCADKFSTNKATNKAYHKIFELIYLKNILQKEVNKFGYSEIHSQEFKKISKRKYNAILQDLFKNNLIYTNIPLNLGHTLGAKSIGGEKIIRGYKIDNSVNYKDNSLILSCFNFNFSSSLNSPLNSSLIPFKSFGRFLINKGEHFLKEGKYDIEKVYNYIDIDMKDIPYQEGSEEWNELAKKWNNHSHVKKSRNRLYSWFHSIHGEERHFFTLNGSNFREAFDVPACNFCILAKLLEEKNVNQNELRTFQNIIRYDYVYRRIAKFIGIELNDLNKKEIKQACQHWLNIRKRYKHNGSKTDVYFNHIDQFFKFNFPSIYSTLLNWREEEYNGKITKMLWDDFQEVEFDIISNKICTYLYKKYEVFPVTVHDALYLTDEDMKKINEKIEDIFWKELNLKYIK